MSNGNERKIVRNKKSLPSCRLYSTDNTTDTIIAKITPDRSLQKQERERALDDLEEYCRLRNVQHIQKYPDALYVMIDDEEKPRKQLRKQVGRCKCHHSIYHGVMPGSAFDELQTIQRSVKQ